MITKCHACKKDFEIDKREFLNRSKNKIGIFCTPECTRTWQSSFFQEAKKKNPKYKDPVYKDNLKKCNICQEYLSLEEFGARAIKVSGLKHQSHCKSCFSSLTCRRFNAKKLAAVKYLGGNCMLCKKTYPAQVFNFHHRDPSTKKFEWTKLRLQSIKTIIEELDKCDLLCANCHVIEHSGTKNWTNLDKDVERFLLELSNGGNKLYKPVKLEISILQCLNCDNEFEIQNSNLQRRSGKYCSRKCYVNKMNRKADYSQVIIRFQETKNYSSVGREFNMSANNVKRIVNTDT